MSDVSLEKVKQELLERKRELEEKLNKISTEKVSDDQTGDPGDQALSSSMESLRSSFQNTETEEYKRIVKALEKIADGTYGICTDCDQPISAKRLEMYPNAERCLTCQEAYEEQEQMA